MKKNMSKKTISLLVVALLLVSSIGVGSALAYFTTYTQAKGGIQLDLEFADTDINETVEPGQKVLSVKNAETAEACFVRIKVIVTEEYTNKLLFSEPENAGKWTPGDGGYYYYSDIVEPNGETSKLVVSLTGISEIAKDDFNVIVIQESTPVLYKADGTPYADWSVKAEVSESYDVAPLE